MIDCCFKGSFAKKLDPNVAFSSHENAAGALIASPVRLVLSGLGVPANAWC